MRISLKRIVSFVFLFTAVCFCLNLSGKEKKPAVVKKKITLTEKEVNKCIAVLPVFLKKFPSFNPLTGIAANLPGNSGVKSMASSINIPKLNAFAVSNGYRNFNDFATHFTGIMSGYMYYKTKEMQKMLENLPPATAVFMKNNIKSVNVTLEKLEANVSPEFLKALKPHVAAIDKILGL